MSHRGRKVRARLEKGWSIMHLIARSLRRMHIPRESILLVVVSLWATSGCTVVADGQTETAAAPAVMATIGEEVVTREDVEQTVAADLQRLERERHEILERGLESLVNERLIEMGARADGLEPEQFVEREVAGKIREISDQQVDEFYEAQKSRIGRPKEQVVDQIREYLADQERQAAQQLLIDGLREKYEVRSFLEPLRVAVAIAGAPARGPEDAPITIVEFSDFQCPFCSRVVPTLDRIQEAYGDDVRLVFRHFPLHRIHPQAQKAAEASLCADEQGKFWAMHDAMFADQGGLSIAALKEKAAAVGLDETTFAECLDSGRQAERVDSDLEDGVALGVSGTPAIFINGRLLSGAQPYDEIAKIIDDELRRLDG
jgi:protein-disulfide isomerase